MPSPIDSASTSIPRERVVREVLAVFAISLLSTIVLYRLRGIPMVRENLHALVGTIFLLAPIILLQRRGESFERFGIALGGLLGADRRPGVLGLVRDLAAAITKNRTRLASEIGFAIAAGCVVFPVFVVGFRLWWRPDRAFDFHAPSDFWGVAAAQLLVVGLPEEFFYRGYVQTRLTDAYPRTVRVFGAELSPIALVATSTLFALGHFLVDLDPARLAVFFPSFLFGWMRARRGSIAAAAIFHALCNVVADILMIGYFGNR